MRSIAVVIIIFIICKVLLKLRMKPCLMAVSNERAASSIVKYFAWLWLHQSRELPSPQPLLENLFSLICCVNNCNHRITISALPKSDKTKLQSRESESEWEWKSVKNGGNSVASRWDGVGVKFQHNVTTCQCWNLGIFHF